VRADTAATNHTLRVKDLRMHYVAAGHGPPVVLIHGWPQTSYAWRLVQPLLAQHFTVITPDVRGAGHTTKTAAGYDADNLADDLYQLVAALGHTRVLLVGHDWGAVWAYHYAAQHPNDVAGLVNLEMAIPGTGFHETAMVPKPNGRFFWHMGWQSVPEVPEMLIRGNEAVYLRFVIENVAYDPTAITPDALAHYVEAIRRPGALRASLAIYQQYWTHAAQADQHRRTKLDIPTLAYGGDALLRDIPRSSMEQLANNVEGGVVEGCGHFIPEEQPAWLADTLTNFFTAALASAPPTSDSEPARA
jgi:pimeloyl-ACP methyl ester carboxylesterase